MNMTLRSIPSGLFFVWFGMILPALLPVSACGQEVETGPDVIALGPKSVKTDDISTEQFRAAAIEKWSEDIEKLAARDAAEPDPRDAVLFIGSSSIRLWGKTIRADVAPYQPIERGYGGAKFTDIAVFADRLITPHQYRALVVFAANDVSGKPEDRTLAEIEAAVKQILAVSAQHAPQAPMLIVEVTPTRSRFDAWDQIRAVNALLREICLTTPNCYFVPTAEHYLTAEGEPRDELFGDDELHLNAFGYQLWGRLIRTRLDQILAQRAIEKK